MNRFRYKSALAVRGMQQKFVFPDVHVIFLGSFSDDFEWKEDETRECRFIFIGRKLNKAALIQGFENCKAEETKQFDVRDKVQANIGHWTDYVIIVNQLDMDNPNRIDTVRIIHRYDIGADGTNVWGHIDDDTLMREKVTVKVGPLKFPAIKVRLIAMNHTGVGFSHSGAPLGGAAPGMYDRGSRLTFLPRLPSWKTRREIMSTPV